MDQWAFIALGIQIIAIFVTIYSLRNHPEKESIEKGAIFTIIILFLKDALPWISIWQTDFLYTQRPHHSSYGLLVLLLMQVYRKNIEYCMKRWSQASKIKNFIEEFKIPYCKCRLFYFGIGIVFTSILTQIHEIIYFRTLFFPDRGFPLDIILRFSLKSI